jgi:hypothetical protein
MSVCKSHSSEVERWEEAKELPATSLLHFCSSTAPRDLLSFRELSTPPKQHQQTRSNVLHRPRHSLRPPHLPQLKMAPAKRKGPGDMAGVAHISPQGITGLDDEMEVQMLGAGQEVRFLSSSCTLPVPLADPFRPSTCSYRSVDRAASSSTRDEQ